MLAQIEEGVWQGNVNDAAMVSKAREMGLIEKETVILTVTIGSPLKGEYVFELIDEPGKCDYVLMTTAIEKLIQLRAEKKDVMVHCIMGQSRSGAVVCGYLMKRYNMSFEDAYKLLKEKKPDADLKWDWPQRLKEFEQDFGFGNVDDLSLKEEAVRKWGA